MFGFPIKPKASRHMVLFPSQRPCEKLARTNNIKLFFPRRLKMAKERKRSMLDVIPVAGIAHQPSGMLDFVAGWESGDRGVQKWSEIWYVRERANVTASEPAATDCFVEIEVVSRASLPEYFFLHLEQSLLGDQDSGLESRASCEQTESQECLYLVGPLWNSLDYDVTIILESWISTVASEEAQMHLNNHNNMY